jgi:hypothetical protein
MSEDFQDDEYNEVYEIDENDDDCFEECLECQRARIRLIEETCQDLARRGLICDSGRRRWSERMQSLQIVWISVPPKEEQH